MIKPENILIRSDGSAAVADFNTTMYLDSSPYFSRDSHQIIREANDRHVHPSLSFIDVKLMGRLIELCVGDDSMCRPSFEIIRNFIFEKFIKETSKSSDLACLTRIPRIDKNKLNQLRVSASRGSNEVIIEYGEYLLHEDSFVEALHILLKGVENKLILIEKSKKRKEKHLFKIISTNNYILTW